MYNDPDRTKQPGAMFPKTSERLRHKHRHHSAETGEACGCCPACGEFVVIENINDGTGSPCPSCGSSVNRLVPLGEGT
jgi:hypothetical protein